MEIEQNIPTVSVVVLSYNRFEYTANTIKSLLTHKSGVNHEIIIVDNGSDDHIPESLQSLLNENMIDKLVLLPENLGTSAGYNAGFKASNPSSSFLTKLDNDILILSDNWLAEILAIFDEVQEAGIVSTDIINHKALKQLQKIKLPSGREVKDWAGWRAGGGGMTFRRETYEKHGGFSENFPSDLKLMPDDLEYYFRLASFGYKGFYACASKSKMQTELNHIYENYMVDKTRQYHLLRTRFFGVAKKRGNEYQPYIVCAEISPQSINNGNYITVNLTINCYKDTNIGVGMTLTNISNKNNYYDRANDVTVIVQSGYNDIARQFYINETIPAGRYNINISICKGLPGCSVTYDRFLQKNILEIM